MNTSFDKVDFVYDFIGSWGIESKCGLKHFSHEGKDVVVVTELYLENKGTSITQVTASLAAQICNSLEIDPYNLMYIEHCPDMNSKLSFYNEEFYKVDFQIREGKLSEPAWKMLTSEEVMELFKSFK